MAFWQTFCQSTLLTQIRFRLRSLLAGHSVVVIVPRLYFKRNVMEIEEANVLTFLKRFLVTCRYYVHSFVLIQYCTIHRYRGAVVYQNALEVFNYRKSKGGVAQNLMCLNVLEFGTESLRP